MNTDEIRAQCGGCGGWSTVSSEEEAINYACPRCDPGSTDNAHAPLADDCTMPYYSDVDGRL